MWLLDEWQPPSEEEMEGERKRRKKRVRKTGGRVERCGGRGRKKEGRACITDDLSAA